MITLPHILLEEVAEEGFQILFDDCSVSVTSICMFLFSFHNIIVLSRGIANLLCHVVIGHFLAVPGACSAIVEKAWLALRFVDRSWRLILLIALRTVDQ